MASLMPDWAARLAAEPAWLLTVVRSARSISLEKPREIRLRIIIKVKTTTIEARPDWLRLEDLNLLRICRFIEFRYPQKNY